jgi:hypothetical protein
MIIYLFNIIVWTWIYCICKNKKRALIYNIIILFLLMGLRSYNIGTDTEGYCINYVNYIFKDWKNILQLSFSIGDMNYGFLILNKFLSEISSSYTFYLLCISGIISFSLYKFLKIFSCNSIMSLIILLSLGFIFFFMSGIKQTLAIAFILLAYIKLRENKILNFILLVLLATSFHNTALIVLICLPIYKLNLRRMYILLIPLIAGSGIIFQNKISSFFQLLVFKGKYRVYGTDYVAVNNLTGLYIQIIIVFVVIILIGYRLKEDSNLQFFISIYSIGIFFQALTPVIAEFFRISMYFSIISSVMLPYTVKYSKIKQKRLVYISMGIVFIFYFLVANINNTAMIPYEFFGEIKNNIGD